MTAVYPPGPKSTPLVGNARQFAADPLGVLMACSRDYGEVAHLRFGARHAYVLNNPDHVRQVLVEKAEHFHKSPLFKKNTQRVIGNGLLTSEGELHRRQRRLMQPAFHHQRIAGYADIMVAQASAMFATWRDGETRDIHADMTRLTMEIVSRALFGSDVSTTADALGEAIVAGLDVLMRRMLNPLSPPEWIPTPMNRRARRSADVLNSTIMGMIEARRASGEDGGDLLSMLLLAVDEQNGSGMSNQQARDEVMTLFIAGHETTANALAWTMMLLAQHPAAAETLRAEIDSVLGGRVPSYGDLPGLPYTAMVVRESLRLYPPAWIIPRMAIRDVVIGGWTITPGSLVFISPYTLHRTPAFFAEPERFMPERFAEGYEDRLPRYAYLPFGAGPRICIGNSFALMEARLILASLVQRFRFDLLPDQDLTPDPLVTLRPRHGIRMTVRQRVQPEGMHKTG